MRKLLTHAAALALSLLLGTGPLSAAESTIKDELQLPKKDQCLLFAKNCDDNAYVIQQRVDRLRNELFKGSSVYSNEELEILKRRLDEAQKALEFIFTDGA